MAEIKLTADQRLTVESRGASILVSAAAGSGKTKVLVERLMSYVTDEQSPKSVDSFLIITYTRAAASQLRSRIIESISERLAGEPGNRHLRRQSALCYRARIGTIHSFCTSVLRENCHLAGLVPDFRVVEESRAEQIKASVLDKLLEKKYESIEQDAPFQKLVDTIGAGRDDKRLSSMILELHGKMLSHAWPEKWAAEQENVLFAEDARDISETLWGAELISEAAASAGYWEKRMGEITNELASQCGENARITKAYFTSFDLTRESLAALCSALETGWDAAREHLPVEFPRLGSLRNDPDPEFSGRIKNLRAACKKDMDGLEKSLSDSSERLLEEMRACAPVMRELLRLTLKFDEMFSAEKRRQGLVDFSDLEHLTVKLLYDPERNEPTALARELSRQFTEIMVDEYQDVNEVQELIFRSVSNNNLFMVGDVKQSIYRFRLADPGIFLEKYRSFTPAACAGKGEAMRINLSANFRSRGSVLEAANHVFENIMSCDLGEIDYDEEAKLRLGAEYYDASLDKPVVFDILPSPDSDEPDAPSRQELEALHVAERIKALVDSGAPVTDESSVRPVRYGDCVILLRSPGPVGKTYRRALAEAGIPVLSEQGGGFFTSLEVSITLSLLAVIDDPHQDVPLITVLRSPIFGLSSDELSAIRTSDRDTDFYGAVCLYANENEKCARFVRELMILRKLSPDLGADELLRHIYTRFDLPVLCSAMPDGAARRQNLMQLLEYARQFEGNGYRGLFRFVEWLNRMAERGEEPAASGGSGDAVRIMSIHKSKGLEFPYVFIPDTARRFNRQDTMGTVLIHAKLGLGPKYTDEKRRTEYPTAARRAIAQRISRENLSEEMRVLYVGMTRAKERLFLSCVWKNAEEKLEKLNTQSEGPIASQVLDRDSSFSDWLARCALLSDSPMELNLLSENQSPEELLEEESTETEEVKADADTELVAELSRKLAFSYAHEGAVNLPSKLTATETKGRQETADPDDAAQVLMTAGGDSFRKPDLGAKKSLTGTERGIAAHLVLQHMDFSRTSDLDSVRSEISRLENEGFITHDQAAAVEPRAILSFFESKLGKRVLNCGKLRREFKFSLLCPAEEFYAEAGTEGENLLLQGVVDCCIEEDGFLTIIDYKTDFVTPELLDEKEEQYKNQLRAYGSAMSRILGKPVRDKFLYFLRGGYTVLVK